MWNRLKNLCRKKFVQETSIQNKIIEIKPSGFAPYDRIQLQAQLDKARGLKPGERLEIRLASGIFLIDRCLVVYSNTTLALQPDTVMRRTDQYRIILKSYTDKMTPGYGNVHDIVIDGGIWDGASTTTDKYRKLIKFSHAGNITLRNATIRRVSGKHCVTFAAVSGVRVENVHFTEYIGFADTEKRRANAEQLHIDGISDDGVSEPNEQPYDNTPCRDVRIEGCVFDGGCSAVGSHYQPFKAVGDGFTVRGCTFRNYLFPPIHVFHFENVCIEDNTFINCAMGSRESGEAEEKAAMTTAQGMVYRRQESKRQEIEVGGEERVIGGVRMYDCSKVWIQ